MNHPSRVTKKKLENYAQPKYWLRDDKCQSLGEPGGQFPWKRPRLLGKEFWKLFLVQPKLRSTLSVFLTNVWLNPFDVPPKVNRSVNMSFVVWQRQLWKPEFLCSSLGGPPLQNSLSFPVKTRFLLVKGKVTEPTHLEPALHNKKNHDEKPVRCN